MKPALRVRLFLFGLCATLSLNLGIYAAYAHGDDSHAKDQDHIHHHHFAQLAKAPEKARTQPNPLETDPQAAAAGKKLFEQHCAECHGTTAEGGRKAPNLRAPEIQQATPGTLFWILTNGVVRRGMPVWSKLPEPERWQLVTFLKSLPPSTTPGPTAMHSQSHRTPQSQLEYRH